MVGDAGEYKSYQMPSLDFESLSKLWTWDIRIGIKAVPFLVRCGSRTNQCGSLWACDTRVKEGYMNEPSSHLNESNPEDMMVKKDSKKLKVTTYTNKLHLLFQWLNHRNSTIKCVLL